MARVKLPGPDRLFMTLVVVCGAIIGAYVGVLVGRGIHQLIHWSW